MTSKKIVIFGLFLVLLCLVYVKYFTQGSEQKNEPIPIETNAGNLDVFLITETDNSITVKACDTGKFARGCSTNQIPMITEQNGIKVYRKTGFDVAFLKENGQWKSLGNVFLLQVMGKPQKPKPIFARDCGDWQIAIKTETDHDITVEDCAWGMGWDCGTYKLPKVSDKDGIKVYKKSADGVVFTNNNGKWGIANHMCADRKIEKRTGPIFQTNCMDFEMLVTAETDKDITVKRDFRKIYNIPKVADKNGIKVYSDGTRLYHKDIEAFVNNNDEWELLGHLCSRTESVKVLEYKCPNSARTINVNDYTGKGLIYIDINNCTDSDVSVCDQTNSFLFMLKDTEITDKEVFTNGNLQIEHSNETWIVDDKICE